MKQKRGINSFKNFICIDETNNGFHLGPEMILIGYLQPNLGRANYGSSKLESKRKSKIFSHKKINPS